MKYVIEYYLPNQSHLFSAPNRYGCKSEKDLAEKIAIAEAHGYDLVCVYEVCDTYLNPMIDDSTTAYEEVKQFLARV